MRNQEFYRALSQRKMEEIRAEIRELTQYLEQESQQTFYIDLVDSEVSVSTGEPYAPIQTTAIYKQRVERFIREHRDHLTIFKLSNNQPITSDELLLLEQILFSGDELGTKEDYLSVYGEQPLGAFIRSIVGLDQQAAQAAFSGFLQAGNLSADQMTFIQNIVTHLTKNGMLDKTMLFEPPFTRANDQGLFGLFDDADAGKIIRIIDGINGNAMIG